MTLPPVSRMRLETERLLLEPIEPGRAAAMADFQSRNRDHIGPWDPSRPPDFYTEAGWVDRIASLLDEENAGRSRRWCCVPKAGPDLIVATVNLTEIVRGPLQACFLGYAIDAKYERTGLMSEAVRAAVNHGFDTLRLHRIGANYVPENERSGRLLKRLGFQIEGHASQYLFINGSWRDHVLTAKINPNPQPPLQPESQPESQDQAAPR
jgi:[ribosomal protein S5]-alanine N-acetyltransferase